MSRFYNNLVKESQPTKIYCNTKREMQRPQLRLENNNYTQVLLACHLSPTRVYPTCQQSTQRRITSAVWAFDANYYDSNGPNF